MLYQNYGGGYEFGMACLTECTPENGDERIRRATEEVLSQINSSSDGFLSDMDLLSCVNGCVMSSIKTHNTYGFVCNEEGRGMIYVRFEGSSEWIAVY